jgi:hypothetical protein
MSSPEGKKDPVRLPLEYTTEAEQTVQDILQQTIEAQENIRELEAKKQTLPKRGRGTGDTTSASAFAREDDKSEFGGIFATATEDIGLRGRDKTSKQPLQKENEFTKLRDQVQGMEQKMSMGEQVQGGLGQLSGAVGMAGLAGGAGGVLGKLGSMATKAFIPLAIVTTIVEVAVSIFQEMLKPGGPLDRRFKRVIGDEIAATTSLQEKEEINQGFKVIRISTQPGLRGEAGVTSNLQKRTVMYDLGIARSMQGYGG